MRNSGCCCHYDDGYYDGYADVTDALLMYAERLERRFDFGRADAVRAIAEDFRLHPVNPHDLEQEEIRMRTAFATGIAA